MYRRLLRYDLRICTGLGPWLIVVPVAGTMLVLFALMAMTSLVRAHTPVRILELLGPLLLAFVGVNLLRPEYQYNTLETVLTRPVSFHLILVTRVLFAAALVVALQVLLCLYMRTVMDKQFNATLAMLAALASIAFLASLAIAVAATWRSPMLGFGAAAAFWALDLVCGPRLNPVLTLNGYSADLARPDELWGHWWVGKTVLAALALLLVVVAGRAARRPAVQRSARRWVRGSIHILLIALAYVWSGAAYKVEWGRRHEVVLLNNSRQWYQRAFQMYGPVPVAHLFGPSFARLIGYRPPWVELPTAPGGQTASMRSYDRQQLRALAYGHPNSIWADNALFELGRSLIAGEVNLGSPSQESREGIRCLESLASDHPDSPFAPLGLEKLVYVYEQRGRTAEGESAVRRLLTLCPESPSAQSAGRMVLSRLALEGRLEDALWIAETLAASASADDRPAALVEVGEVLVSLGRLDEARASYAEAVEIASGRTRALALIADKSPEDVQRLRELAAASRRAAEQLETLAASPEPGPE